MKTWATVGLGSAVAAAVAGCGRSGPGPTSEPLPALLVSVRAGAVAAPDSVAAGWTRIRVEEEEGRHILVVFRLPETATDSEVAAFLAAVDTARATPAPAFALGGPEIGASGEVIIRLTTGRQVLVCMSRGADGRRHGSSGEARTLWVVPARLGSGRDSAAPRATAEVQLVDFAYVGADRWPAGSHLLRIENRGKQDHQLRLARLRAGATVQTWIKADEPDSEATPVVGMARLGPGGVAYLPVELSPGGYLVYCLVPDAASGRPHVELGMFRAIQVQ